MLLLDILAQDQRGFDNFPSRTTTGRKGLIARVSVVFRRRTRQRRYVRRRERSVHELRKRPFTGGDVRRSPLRTKGLIQRRTRAGEMPVRRPASAIV
jgi:hypothetical protein